MTNVKKNKGRFKTRVITSLNNSTPPPAAAKPEQPRDDTPMTSSDPSIPPPPPTDTSSPPSPVVSLSRPFRDPSSAHPPLVTLEPLLLPSSTPSSAPLAKVNRLTQLHSHSHLLRSSTLRKSWKEKQRVREERVRLKAKEKSMAAEALKLRLEEKRKREQRAKQKAENEKKSRIVQVIKDSSKIKRMSKAQLKSIEKA